MHIKDPIVEYKIIEECPSCLWKHKGDEKLNGVDIYEKQDGSNRRYFICHLTMEKVFI